MTNIKEMMDGIRTLVTLKEFPDTVNALDQKLLWAFNELSDAMISHLNNDPIYDVQSEFIDVVFYILDFWGIAYRDRCNYKINQTMYLTEFDEFISPETPYSNMNEVFNLILVKLGKLTDKYKKGINWTEIEEGVADLMLELSNATYWYGKMRLDALDLNGVELHSPSEIFNTKLKKNLGKEKQFGQKRSISLKV